MAKISLANPVKAAITKKRKRKPKLSKTKSQNKKIKNLKPLDGAQVKSLNTPKDDNDTKDEQTETQNEQVEIKNEQTEDKKAVQSLSDAQFAERFPVFKDEGLIKKFQAVTLTNNQKGRLRQTLRDSFKGVSDSLLPDVIHNRIQAIVKETADLTDAELRKIRILYNMLKTAAETKPADGKAKKNKKKKKGKKDKELKGKDNKSESEIQVKDDGDESINETSAKDEVLKSIETKTIENEDVSHKKVENIGKDVKDKPKGPKRYVVFVGNLPLDIDKEKIMKHFSEFKDYIIDVRIPKQKEGKRSAIAYVELKNELCYELALSKHHSMLNNKRINVLYTAHKNSKLSRAEAKGKAAKLVALQKSGKLAGSVPLNRKRSQRRMKAKRAQAKQAADA